MISPAFIDGMSWRMAEVYGACVDKLLINLAHYFPYIQDGREPKGTFEYMARMLAKMGQVTQESVNIIVDTLGDADPALRNALITAIDETLQDVDPPLRKAAEAGLFGGRQAPPKVSADMTQAFQMYYRQSADKLNLVNTAMLESTQQAYTGCIANVVQSINNAQGALNIATGQVVTGVSTWNEAMRQAVNTMVQNGITGFVDHAGRHWSPEAYVAMDIRTTVSNTARATVWEQNEQYGNDLYSVSTHNGARPLCYPWQAKVISRTDTVRDVEDLHGDIVHVYAQSETSYGQAAGLFGINCGHYPYPFVPGLSVVRGEPQDEEDNAKTYEESQQQRKLERDLRYARRDLAVAKAQGAPPEELDKYKDKVKQANANLDDFCDKTGRNRRRSREYTPVNAKFPPKDSYDVTQFDTTQRDAMQQYFANGGVQSGMNPDTVFPTEPITAMDAEQTLQETPSVITHKQGEFTPATTIQEAEQQAQQFAGSASYKGIGLDYANTCNRVLADVNATYDVRPLSAIQPMNMRTNAFKNSTSEAAYRWGSGDLFINPRFYKSPATFAAHKAEVDSLMETVLGGGEKLLATATGRKKEYLQTLLTTKRQCVAQSYDFVEGTFVHECGHMLDDRLFSSKIRDAFGGFGYAERLAESRHRYGVGISGYAVADNHEYIAESFTAWWYGEGDKIDPVIRSIFEGLMRQ